MRLPISRRLLSCAGFIHPGEIVADIGCDHGYLGIHLLQNGIADRVLAADIKPGPLQSARRNAQKYGVANRMSFYLSAGVCNVPQDFDVMVCAGMGADTMISILDAAPWLKSPRYRLILQCQSKSQDLRRHLSSNGWQITDERILRDGRFLYSVMEVCYRPGCPLLTSGECYFSPAMLEHPSPEMAEYYHHTIKLLEHAIQARGSNADPEMILALQQLSSLSGHPDLIITKEDSPYDHRA